MIEEYQVPDAPESSLGTQRSEGRRLARRSVVERLVSILSPVVLLLLWEALVRVRLLDYRFFAAPSEVAQALADLLISGVLLQHIAISLSRIAAGFALGASAGLALGLLMGVSRLVRAAAKPLVGVIYPIPKIAIFPLVMLIFGIGERSKYVIVAIGVFFLVLLNTMAGVLNIDRIYLDVGKNFGARRFDVLRTIAFPGALPLILTGLRLGWGTALLLIVAAEFLAAKAGIGYLIWNAWQTFAIAEMFAGLLTISALGLLSFVLLDWIERLVLPWKPEIS